MHADYEDGVLELPDGKEMTPENYYLYAYYVIKDRWPRAEPRLMKDPTTWGEYCKNFGIS